MPRHGATPGPATAAKVLIVDDERDLVDTMKRVLDRAGYRVDVALDANSALAKIRMAEPDVILSDFHMPGMTASEFYAELERSHPRVCGGFVLMVGDPTSDRVRAFVDRAHVQCLAKPFAIPLALRVIAAAANAAGQPGKTRAHDAPPADKKPRARGKGAG